MICRMMSDVPPFNWPPGLRSKWPAHEFQCWCPVQGRCGPCNLRVLKKRNDEIRTRIVYVIMIVLFLLLSWLRVSCLLWLNVLFLCNLGKYLVGGLVAIFYFPIYWGEFHHPNWRSHIFQRGGPGPTNQDLCYPLIKYVTKRPWKSPSSLEANSPSSKPLAGSMSVDWRVLNTSLQFFYVKLCIIFRCGQCEIPGILGGFRFVMTGYPQSSSISNDGIFQCIPTIFDTPHLWNPPYDIS